MTVSCEGSGDPCHADLNGDGFVNGADLGLLLTAFGTNDPNADINATVDTFIKHERALEDDVLKRLGVSRPEAKQEAASEPSPESSLPHRGKTSAGTAPIEGGVQAPANKSMTLRQMKASLFKGRRRPR